MLIGLDVGTTACKALLFEIDGRIIAASSRPYELITRHDGWVEQDGEMLWLTVVSSLRDLAAQIPPGRQILALAQSSQGERRSLWIQQAFPPITLSVGWTRGRRPSLKRCETGWGRRPFSARRAGLSWPDCPCSTSGCSRHISGVAGQPGLGAAGCARAPDRALRNHQ